jgi:hypothetical protein
MFISAFFSWWYGEGWSQVVSSLSSRLDSVASAFSVNQLLSTLFAPWRRIITYPGASLAEKFHAWSDNIFSRTIGFIIRLIVLLTALLISIVVVLISLVELVIWPLLPIGIVAGVIAGLIW